MNDLQGAIQHFFTALPLVFLAWLDMVLTPFSGFTFTDPADFIFVTLIPLTLLGIACLHMWRPESANRIKFAERAAYFFAVVGPLAPLAALYLASWSASHVLGHWPRVMLDDPKHIQGHQYELLSSCVSYAMAFGGWSMISLGALLLHLRYKIPARRLVWIVCAFLVSSVILVTEPGARYLWWLD